METIIGKQEIPGALDLIIDAQDKLQQIMDWDLSRIKQYMVNKAICDIALIDDIETEYKRFMFLCVVSEDRKVPTSQEVDKMWHVHILFTHNYIAFCEATRGSYIHHNPTVSDNERSLLKDVYEHTTLRLYKAYFGEPSDTFWQLGKQICAEECDDSPGDGQPV